VGWFGHYGVAVKQFDIQPYVVDVPDSSKRKAPNVTPHSLKRLKMESSSKSSHCEPGPSSMLMKRTTMTSQLDIYDVNNSQPSTSSSQVGSSSMGAAPITHATFKNLLQGKSLPGGSPPVLGDVGGFPGVCNICRMRPNTAVMVHQGTGHQYSCYKCSLKWKRSGKGCPVCRKPITHIIKNFIVYGDES